MTNLVGVIDGGCNRARHNGDAIQCKEVACGYDSGRSVYGPTTLCFAFSAAIAAAS